MKVMQSFQFHVIDPDGVKHVVDSPEQIDGKVEELTLRWPEYARETGFRIKAVRSGTANVAALVGSEAAS